MTVLLQDLICVCHVFARESFNSASRLKNWLSLSPYHFYIKYSFPSMNVKSWSQRKQVRPSDLGVCAPCTSGVLEELRYLNDFFEDAHCRPLKTLDIFGGVGAFSMGLGEGSGCLEVTDVVELAPSAAKTVM